MKRDKKIELLAPAGTPDAFYGAVAAGADAVYLAGNRYGARAYANNFGQDELIEAIRYAHLFGVKVYLTVNTIFKNKETEQLADFIRPFYEVGLDGVIVQDLGVLAYMKKHFPDMERHISTQMTVTSVEGARFLVENGASRVVPARELTMEELKAMCEAGIEVESFIHGSMCYAYSGQCFFSSMIGGRSGNRGRCAQPCRLPYRYGKKQDEYCFSLKDMCTLEYLPEILESGIASLKIEGRMKSAAYAAGVTAIYRKYIDLYEANPEEYRVRKEDLEQLRHLYIRTGIEEGYYRQKRGAGMITLQSPAYSKTDDSLMEAIMKQYCVTKKRLPTELFVSVKTGEPVRVTVTTECRGRKFEITQTGAAVQEAQKAPLQQDDVRKRMEKSGDSLFEVRVISAEVDTNAFLPVKALNEIRRSALDELYQLILNETEVEFAGRRIIAEESSFPALMIKTDSLNTGFYEKLKVFVENETQWNAVTENPHVRNIVIPAVFMLRQSCREKVEEDKKHDYYLRLPVICRKEHFEQTESMFADMIASDRIKGVYVNQVDSMAYMKRHYPDKYLCGDINLYATNNIAIKEILQSVNRFTVSVELKADELKHLTLEQGELMIYGRYPLMNTANCVFLTHGDCRRGKGEALTYLKDRKGSSLPVIGYCEEAVCHNTVYNSVPTSLHKNADVIRTMNLGGYQLRFVDEDVHMIKDILALYHDVFVTGTEHTVSFPFTNGHFKRGIE